MKLQMLRLSHSLVNHKFSCSLMTPQKLLLESGVLVVLEETVTHTTTTTVVQVVTLRLLLLEINSEKPLLLLLVKVVNKEPTMVVTEDGQTVVMVLKVMLPAQVVEVSLVYSILHMVLTGKIPILLLSLVQAVVEDTKLVVPVEVKTVVTVWVVELMALLNLLVDLVVKVSTVAT